MTSFLNKKNNGGIGTQGPQGLQGATGPGFPGPNTELIDAAGNPVIVGSGLSYSGGPGGTLSATGGGAAEDSSYIDINSKRNSNQRYGFEGTIGGFLQPFKAGSVINGVRVFFPVALSFVEILPGVRHSGLWLCDTVPYPGGVPTSGTLVASGSANWAGGPGIITIPFSSPYVFTNNDVGFDFMFGALVGTSPVFFAINSNQESAFYGCGPWPRTKSGFSWWLPSYSSDSNRILEYPKNFSNNALAIEPY